jgi:hypothetical protein
VILVDLNGLELDEVLEGCDVCPGEFTPSNWIGWMPAFEGPERDRAANAVELDYIRSMLVEINAIQSGQTTHLWVSRSFEDEFSEFCFKAGLCLSVGRSRMFSVEHRRLYQVWRP